MIEIFAHIYDSRMKLNKSSRCDSASEVIQTNMGEISWYYIIMKTNEVQPRYNMHVVYRGIWVFCNKIKISTIFDIYVYDNIRDN